MKPYSALRSLLFQAIFLPCMLLPASAETPLRQSQPEGVLAGSVSRGPVAPHESPRALHRSQVAGAIVEIATADGQPVTSVKTDSLGNFAINLQPGRYRVTVRAMHGARPRNMPATVIIAAGAERRLDIFLDTGLR